jgi:hypothetical protein
LALASTSAKASAKVKFGSEVEDELEEALELVELVSPELVPLELVSVELVPVLDVSDEDVALEVVAALEEAEAFELAEEEVVPPQEASGRTNNESEERT